MKVFSSPLSPFASKTRIALDEKGIAYDDVRVPWTRANGWGPKPAEMLAINPKAQIPVVVDGDLTLYDSTIIFEYLEEQYPKPPLYPSNVADRARCRLLEDFGDTVVAEPMVVLVNEIFKKPDPASRNQSVIDKACSALADASRRLDVNLAGKDYLCGDFTVADISCYVPLNVAAFVGVAPAASLGNLNAWMARVRQRPSIQRQWTQATEVLQALKP